MVAKSTITELGKLILINKSNFEDITKVETKTKINTQIHRLLRLFA